MRHVTSAAARLVLAALLAVLAAPAAAHELKGPESISADGDGHFAYEVSIVITEPIEFAWSEQDGTDNTDLGHWIADGFCMVVWEAGTHTWSIEGNLVDLQQDGSVIYTHAMCDGWTAVLTTTIVAPDVAVAPTTWGTIKARYR